MADADGFGGNERSPDQNSGRAYGGWLLTRDVRPGAPVRLFCLPHAGSGSAGFYRWKRLLGPRGIDVCPVLLPGREMRLAEPSVTDAAALAKALVEAAGPLLREPYAIFGHSMGALLAYRWAVAIRDAGLPPPRVLLVSGRNAPAPYTGRRNLHLLPDKEFLQELRVRYGAAPETLMDDPELRALFLPILRADLHLVETYEHPEDDRLSCPIVALAGVDDSSVTPDGLTAWAQLTSGPCTLSRLPGGHFGSFAAAQTVLLAVIERELLP